MKKAANIIGGILALSIPLGMWAIAWVTYPKVCTVVTVATLIIVGIVLIVKPKVNDSI